MTILYFFFFMLGAQSTLFLVQSLVGNFRGARIGAFWLSLNLSIIMILLTS